MEREDRKQIIGRINGLKSERYYGTRETERKRSDDSKDILIHWEERELKKKEI